MDASASTLAPEIGGVKLGCASNPMRVLNRLLAPPYIFIKILILNVLYNCKSYHIHFDIQFVNANDEIQF